SRAVCGRARPARSVDGSAPRCRPWAPGPRRSPAATRSTSWCRNTAVRAAPRDSELKWLAVTESQLRKIYEAFQAISTSITPDDSIDQVRLVEGLAGDLM